MNSDEILQRVTARTGQNVPSPMLYAELNNAIRELWLESDPPGSLQEVFVQTGNTAFVLCLPPYVYQVKGIRQAFGMKVTYYTPRPYYDDGQIAQRYLEWRELGRSPLFRSLSGAGPLTFRAQATNSEAFRVIVQGPDAVSNHQQCMLDFGTSDVLKRTPKAFTDVIEIAKTKITDSDINIYDVQDQLVGILLAREQRADCLVIRVTDPAVAATSWPNTIHQILYKCRPPFVREDEVISFDDTVGRTITDKVSAEILGRSKEAADQGRARAYEKRATRGAESMVVHEGEGKQQPLKLTTSPYYHLYHGIL